MTHIMNFNAPWQSHKYESGILMPCPCNEQIASSPWDLSTGKGFNWLFAMTAHKGLFAMT